MSAPFILIAEDDEDDCFLLKRAFESCGFIGDIRFVENGVVLLDTLKAYAEEEHPQFPSLILLDLNMPKKDGREALKEIKETPEYRRIPVVVFSTTASERDIRNCYNAGANSFITKPNSYTALLEIIATLNDYWFRINTYR